MNLPMTAFKINGTNVFIKLTIDEVLEFPPDVYGGGHSVKGLLTIRAGAYCATADHYFTTGELSRFYAALSECYETVSGIAELHNTAHMLELKIMFDKQRGHVAAVGWSNAVPHEVNQLAFEIKTDQTHIKSVLVDLKRVHDAYGDIH